MRRALAGAARDFMPLRGSYQWVRLFGAGAAVAWVATVQPVIVPFATVTVALAIVSTLVINRVEARLGRPLDLAEHPTWLVLADMLAIAAWVLATSLDETTVAWILFSAVAAEAAFRWGARGATGVFVLSVVARAAQELLLAASGRPLTAPIRLASEVLVTALLILLFAAVVENYRAASARARSLERVVSSFSSTTDLATLTARLAAGALELIHADYAFVVERGAPLFRIVAVAGERVPDLPIDVKSGIVAEVFRERRTVQIGDYSGWPDAMPSVRESGVRVAMATPVWVEEEVGAAFIVGRYVPLPFDTADRDTLEALAGHGAAVFRNASLVEKIRELEALSRELALATDEQGLLQRVADAATQLLEVESSVVAWLEPGHIEGERVASGIARQLADHGPIRGMRAWIQRERRTLVVEDYQSWPEATEQAKALGYRAGVGVPVTVEGEVLAALVVATTQEGRRFTTSEIGLIETLGAQASVAVRGARHLREREHHAEHLALLNNAARAFSSARDPRSLYDLVYKATRDLVPTDSFYLSLYDTERRQHTYVLCMDEGREWDRDAIYPLGEGPTSEAVRTGRPFVMLEAHTNHVRFGNEKRPSLSAMHVPLRIGDRVIGVVSAQRYVEHGYTEDDVALLEALATHAASAIENAQLLAHTHELYMASVRALAAAVDARDPYTRSHSARTSALARAIAEEMALPQDQVRRVQLGALLHDIGKIGIPDAVLNKPGRFTQQERLVMMTHAALGGAILQAVEPLRELAPIVRHHHERFDGAGYPDGTGGEDVPLASYIVHAADAFEVIVSKRAYKEAQSVEFAVEELRRNTGGQFHPKVVEAFLRVIERDVRTGTGYLQRLGRAGPEELESEISGPAPVIEEYAATSRAHHRQLAILQRLASEITAVLDIEMLADRLLRIVVESMAYENGFLLTLGDGGDYLEVRAAVGPSSSYVGYRLMRGKGISWAVLDGGKAINVREVREFPAFFGPPQVRSSLVVPLMLGADRVGVLGVESIRPNAFGPDDEQLLTTVSHQLAAAIRVARLHQEAKTAASTDALTGLANRRVFFERLEVELLKARQSGTTLAVAMIDVDRLKTTNDTFGHRAGDAALQRIAAVLAAGVRGEDLVARLGGDEFAVLFPGVAQLTAERVMRRLAERIATQRKSDASLPTISWGIAPAPGGTASADAVMDAADQAMYRHKTVAHQKATPA